MGDDSARGGASAHRRLSVMAGGGPPSTPLPRPAPQGVDGGPAATMTGGVGGRAYSRPMQSRSHPIRINHCDGAGALLDGPARDLIQWWIPDVPRATRGVSFVLEGALAHGRSEEKNLPLPPGDAPQPSCAAARGAQRVSELRRAEASAPCLQPLRPLRRARSGRGRQGTERRSKGLRHGSGRERVCK